MKVTLQFIGVPSGRSTTDSTWPVTFPAVNASVMVVRSLHDFLHRSAWPLWIVQKGALIE
jgi:hypothetical protein